MKNFSTKALLLKAIPLQNHKQILTLFTFEYGIIAAVFQNKFQVSPPLEAEFSLTSTRGNLYRCYEICSKNYHPKLRESFSVLQSACLILEAIRQTQPEEREAKDLYLLTTRYLDALPSFKRTERLHASFLLKLLRYEGSLTLSKNCDTCFIPLENCYISEHGCHCNKHKASYAIPIEEEVYLGLKILSEERFLSKLASYPIPDFSITLAKQLYEWYILRSQSGEPMILPT